jgi:hypothetical protein
MSAPLSYAVLTCSLPTVQSGAGLSVPVSLASSCQIARANASQLYADGTQIHTTLVVQLKLDYS